MLKQKNLGFVLLVLMVFPLLTVQKVTAQTAPSIIPDGQSDTNVTYDDAGHALVDIAAPVSDGISHNTFTRFNVTEAGLDFDNRIVGARTIISEVTGGERSLIEGDIEILGQHAHLFIANPNGILVNGSKFINTGGVALSTGKIDFVERVPAPFRTQLNTTLDVTQGEIIIGEGGFSGAMDTLHFLSKSLRIQGPVTNTNPSPFSSLEITTGNSRAEFNSALLPQNDLSQWSTIEAGSAQAEQAFLIDITDTGALASSQITALVTDTGGGVRHAGSILADRQGFSLTTDGAIVIDGGETIAATNIHYTGRTIEITGEIPLPVDSVQTVERFDKKDRFLPVNTILTENFQEEALIQGAITAPQEETRAVFNAANGGIDLIATEGEITATAAIFSSNSDINLLTSKEIALDSVQMFTGGAIDWVAPTITIKSSRERSFVAANKTINLEATKGPIIIEGTRLQGVAEQNEEEADGDLTAVRLISNTDIIIRSLDADRLAVVFLYRRGCCAKR